MAMPAGPPARRPRAAGVAPGRSVRRCDAPARDPARRFLATAAYDPLPVGRSPTARAPLDCAARRRAGLPWKTTGVDAGDVAGAVTNASPSAAFLAW